MAETDEVKAGLSAILGRIKHMTTQELEAWEKRERERIARVRALHLPKDMRRAVLNRQFKDGRTVRREQAIRHLEDSGDLLTIVLYGPTGSGKSVAAARWLCFNENAGEDSTLWLPAPKLDSIPIWGPELGRAKAVDALVIDDLGYEKSKKGIDSAEAIIWDRHHNERPTVITTNLTSEEAEDRYNQRTIKRINQHGAWLLCNRVLRPDNSNRRTT